MDRELAAALAGELPATADIKVADASPVTFSCPADSRGAAFILPNGQLSVIRLAVGQTMVFDSSTGTTSADASTSTGGTIVVVSVPATADSPAPYASDLSRFASAVARIY